MLIGYFLGVVVAFSAGKYWNIIREWNFPEVARLYERVAYDHGYFYPHDAEREPNDWTLLSTSFKPNRYQVAPYVSNGYFGQSLPSEGTGHWMQRSSDGNFANNYLEAWPMDQPRATFGTISGFWNLQERTTHVSIPENLKRGGESVISGIPNWSGLLLQTATGDIFQPGVDEKTVKAFRQSMSLRNGVVHTNVTWKPRSDSPALQLNYTVLAHRARLHLGLVRLDIVAGENTEFNILDVLDGDGAVRSHFGDKAFEDDDNLIWTSVKPWGIENTTAYVFSTVKFGGIGMDSVQTEHTRFDATRSPCISKALSTIAQGWRLRIRAGQTLSVYKYVGVASSDAFPKRTQSIARSAALQAKHTPWSMLFKEHFNAWESVWGDADIIVPGDRDLQVHARATLFHIMTNIRPGTEGPGLSDNSVMVGGLSSDSYAGLVFWDSDTWIYPSILALHPEYAMSINNYRYRLLGQAVANAQSYGYSGALYPWVSGRFGNCTGVGPCKDYQYHLNTDIAQAHWHYFLQTKDQAWLAEKGWPIIKNVADMFAAYVVKNATTGKYDTILLGEPDEYAYNKNNGAYTNAGIRMLLGDWAPRAARILNVPVPGNWSDIAEHITLLYDENEEIITEYEGMPGDWVIRQASVALINYPLDYRISERQAQNDMAFYSAANSPEGPAMTWSVFAISEAQLQESGCAAYTYLIRASEPYLREPFSQFSEMAVDDNKINGGFNPAFPFLTGYGGFLQIFTHGFTGMRPRLDVFYLDPSLPPQIPQGVKVKGMKWQGATFDVDIQLEITTITRRVSSNRLNDPDGAVTVRLGGKSPKPGHYQLAVGQSLVVQTRRPDLNKTIIDGNMAQCKHVASSSAWETEHRPHSAVDGSNATVWQPSHPGRSEITVDLGRPMKLSGFSINWGKVPPAFFALLGRIARESTPVEVFPRTNVAISAPYSPDDALIVRVRSGNLTTEKLHMDAKARFVTLVIEGSQGSDQTVGPTVAEFAVF